MIKIKAGNKEFEIRNVTWLEILGAAVVLALIGGILRALW
jgi:hypothetical protein